MVEKESTQRWSVARREAIDMVSSTFSALKEEFEQVSGRKGHEEALANMSMAVDMLVKLK